jgi:ElaB/YqjD/DUF883 family membrane-anchored ribosome-binding protein
MTSSHRFGMRVQTVVLASALALCPLSLWARASQDRLPDKDVKALIDQVDDARDKFEGNLSSTFKSSTLRGPSGETKVEAFLQDYQDNVKKLKDRYTADYSASAEVSTVLKQATSIHEYMMRSENGTKGRSEWDREASSLTRLAEAYATTFPLPEGATVRRMNDKETAAAASDLSSAADHFKRDLDKDATLAKADKDAVKKNVDALIKLANAVKSRTSDGKPATAEARQLIDQADKLQAFVNRHPVQGAMASWQSMQGAVGSLQQAFGLPE